MDNRIKAKKAGSDIQGLFEKAMNGESGSGPAMGAGLRVLKLMMVEFLEGKTELGAALRDFMERISNRQDPLRRDIPLEVWTAIGPTINTLQHQRRLEDAGKFEQAEQHNGVGLLGTGRGSEEGGNQ